VGVAGVQNVLMCYNTDLRSIYEMYAAKDVPWLHAGNYVRNNEARPCHGLLSFQVWQLVCDAGLQSNEVPFLAVDQAMAEACQPPAPVAARRKRVSQTHNCAGVLALEVPQHSPFRVSSQPVKRHSKLCELPPKAIPYFYTVCQISELFRQS
jgi:hypothetical protein